MNLQYLGIDLGTTNSVCSFFDGEEIYVVRNAQGEQLTPSIIHINSNERVSIGMKARHYRERDPNNAHSEFKRLMGTEQTLDFPACGKQYSPQALSAKIIQTLCDNVKQQFGFQPKRAVVTVPALFDLPQSHATAEAAKLAGLEKIELLQEPVASALAAGWTRNDHDEYWLVFDLGGGTFDVSLLESQDDFLRVVAHGGDNFLGGRDFDKKITEWVIIQIMAKHGVLLKSDEPEHHGFIEQIMVAAEEAKIDLSVQDTATISTLNTFEIDHTSFDVELTIERSLFESLCLPLIHKAIDLCLRLLKEQGVDKELLSKVVLVGGPAMMPLLQKEVALRLAPVANNVSLDPMTLVAKGAALFAATAGLNATDEAITDNDAQLTHKFLLQHPSMSADLNPMVLGRLIIEASLKNKIPTHVRLENSLNHWSSEVIPIEDNVFMIKVSLSPKSSNIFKLIAIDDKGQEVSCSPGQLSIVHGLSLSDPPLSRSIGIALANGQVNLFFERGTPLPVKRTYHHKIIESIFPEYKDSLIIPIVQGEYHQARYCRSIGQLKINADDINQIVPAGTPLEVTLELDRGGNLKAQAYIPSIEQVFSGILQLIVPMADPVSLKKGANTLQQHLLQMQNKQIVNNNMQTLSPIFTWQSDMDDIMRDIERLQGNDQDAGMRASKNLIKLEAEIESFDTRQQLQESFEQDEIQLIYDQTQVENNGSPQEKEMFSSVYANLQKALHDKNNHDYVRQRDALRQLGATAFERTEGAWEYYFNNALSQIHEAKDIKKANQLVKKGERAIENKNISELKAIVYALWDLLPENITRTEENYHSGVL